MKIFAALYKIKIFLKSNLKIPNPKSHTSSTWNLVCFYYLIRIFLNLLMFLSAIPVPLTTALNGSSAI